MQQYHSQNIGWQPIDKTREWNVEGWDWISNVVVSEWKGKVYVAGQPYYYFVADDWEIEEKECLSVNGKHWQGYCGQSDP